MAEVSVTSPPPRVILDSQLRWVDGAPEELRRRSDIGAADPEFGVVVQVPSGMIVAANDRASEVLRLPWDQLVGLTSFDPRWESCAADGMPMLPEHHPAMVTMATGEPIVDCLMGVDAPNAGGAGEFVWVTVSTTPLQDASGEIVGVAVRFRDVTRLEAGLAATQNVIRALRAAARESVLAERRFRLLAESSADLVLQTDLDGVCTWVSPSSLEVLGWSTEDLLGSRPVELVHPDDAAGGAFGLACAGGVEGSARRIELRFATTDGGWRWMSGLFRSLYDDAGVRGGCLVALRDVHVDVERRQYLTYLAEHDVLTGLVNRDTIERILAAALDDARDTGRHIGVLFVDIDHFKSVNDAYGHPTGDRLLRAVTRRLVSTLRETDTVARIGGDEFLAVLPSVREPERVHERAQMILEAMAGSIEPDVPDVSVSIGVVVDDGRSSPEEMIARADAALYRAKSAGRNRMSE